MENERVVYEAIATGPPPTSFVADTEMVYVVDKASPVTEHEPTRVLGSIDTTPHDAPPDKITV